METFLESANIVLVEDDENLAVWIQDFLLQNGLSVVRFDRGNTALEHIQINEVDLILLDIMLPGLNGFDVCKIVREHSQVPVIMLTASCEEYNEVMGLEIGANDYITKPVKPATLLARIRAQLRLSSALKSQSSQSQEVSFGGLYINQMSRRVLLHNEEIALSNGLFSLLWLLANNAGVVVDRDKVFNELVGREYDGLDRRIDVMISALRKLLNDNAQNPYRIKTIWGKGYLFVADSWNE